MKKLNRVLAIAALMAIALPGTGFAGAGEPIPAVGVRELMQHANRYPGPVLVDGVVSDVFPDRKMLALIDVKEFKDCKVVTCAQLTLPVRWGGPMPVVASTVRVNGAVKKQGVRRVFVADAMETVD
jgi:hypothetical protein